MKAASEWSIRVCFWKKPINSGLTKNDCAFIYYFGTEKVCHSEPGPVGVRNLEQKKISLFVRNDIKANLEDMDFENR